MGLVIGDILRFRLAQQPDPTEKPDGHRQLHHDLGRHQIHHFLLRSNCCESKIAKL